MMIFKWINSQEYNSIFEGLFYTISCKAIYRKASFRGEPSAHPDWIIPSVDGEVEMKFQWTI